MSQLQKLLLSLLSGRGDQNIRFADLLKLLEYFEFNVRIKGSHHICTRSDVVEIINLQPVNGMAKPYQVKQVRELVVKYKLAIKELGDE
jgi:uncharacterized membrane protein (DUF2068 family)